MKKNKGLEVPILWFLALHLSLIVNSIQGVFSKLAGRERTLSPMWILFFGLMFVALFTFAVAWQQVLKHMSLTFAFHQQADHHYLGTCLGCPDLSGKGDLEYGSGFGHHPGRDHGRCQRRSATAEERKPHGWRRSWKGGAALMFTGLWKYLLIWIISVFISSIAQVMLKVEANKTHKTRLQEYLNPMVAGAYGIFFVSVFLTYYALKYVPLTYSPIVEPLSYIFVPVIGVLLLHEKLSKRRILGMLIMIAGIAVFSIGG
jgi:drug/metabolite transporter (DMT)-like permease